MRLLACVLLTLSCLAFTSLAIHQTPRQLVGWKKLQASKQPGRADQALISQRASQSGAPLKQTPISALAAGPDGDNDDGTAKYPDIIEGVLTQPLDHFNATTNVTFEQRYWYSLRHYKPNSGKPTPLYVLDSGEVDASTRLPYLDHGILDILANATDGIGIVLEHRYYGKSTPKRADLGPGDVWGVDQLRWLTTEQALEDNAQFVQNVTFKGIPDEEINALRAPNTPVISYGGSYPGGKSAFVRILYPDLIFGSLASSAVIAAIDQFPDYFYPIAEGADPDCSQAIQASVAFIDSIIAPEPQCGGDQPNRDEEKTRQLLALFGVESLTNVADFANLLTYPLGSFQSLNWDPSVSSKAFAHFCTKLIGSPSGPIEPHDGGKATEQDQQTSDASAPATLSNTTSFDVPKVVENLATYIKTELVDPCTTANLTVEDCFGTEDWSSYHNSTELTDETGIAWTFQYCTQWGYLMTAPPYVESTSSPNTFTLSGPKLVSSLLDLNYTSAVCQKGFLPGKEFSVPARPRTDEVNKYGNFSIAYDRLAFIDGQYDPWRPATAHSAQHAYGGARIDTLTRPFKLIADCWHHCDENGNKTYEPPRVQRIHAQQVEFVKHWLTQWNSTEAS